MTRQEMTDGMAKLVRRFRSKHPLSPEEATDWYELLKDIPAKVWNEIVDDWWKHERSFPTPGDLEIRWRQWIGKHPEKQARQEYVAVQCGSCFGYGHIVAIKLTDDQITWLHESESLEELTERKGHLTKHAKPMIIDNEAYGYEISFICSSCDNWERMGLPLWWWKDDSKDTKIWLNKANRMSLEGSGWLITFPACGDD